MNNYEAPLWPNVFSSDMTCLYGSMKLAQMLDLTYVRLAIPLRGTTPTTHRFLSRGKRINAIAAISSNGILTVDLLEGSVTCERFYDFVRGSLIPNMLPFNGVNSQSIAVTDNCAIHHLQEVKQLFRDSGILLFFLPPYSPDLNPIEEAFSYVKTYLCKHDEFLQSCSRHLIV